MGGNSFYSNAEAYAYEILQQKLLKEAQRSAQQTMMELSALKSLLGQGQFIYCIPFGGGCPASTPLSLPFYNLNGLGPSEPPCILPEPTNFPMLPSHTPQCPNNPPCTSTAAQTSVATQPTSSTPPRPASPNHRTGQSIVQVNVKNAQSKFISNKPGQ
ncbi:hypothetical protein RUM43_000890 [Polyplax serrata]|uniref:Uncharacterized protein n=1 Tax=Polyplax serrata TaxID=468196 RepID=A0AAN8XSZ3_POLSC